MHKASFYESGRGRRAAVWLLAAGLALLAAIGARLTADKALARTPLTTDEHSYLFQAYTFLDGGFSRPRPPFSGLLRHKMIIMEPEAGWVSRYPPGHALFLLPGVWLGDAYLSVFCGAALALLFIVWAAALAADDHQWAVSLTAGLLLLASPWYLFTYGTLLGHTSGMLTTSAMLAFYLLWRRTGRSAAAAFAGLAWGYLCLNRTYTALLLAMPCGLDALWTLARRRDRQTLAGAVMFAGAAAAGVAVLLLYNNLVLGNPRLMTYLHYEPLEALGFGRRHYGEHTFAKGMTIMWNNLKLLDLWLWGVPGGLMIWALLCGLARPRRWWLVLIGSALAVPLGYILFFHRGPHETGPGYYFEILPFMTVGAALGAVNLWLIVARRWPAARVWLPVLPAVALIAVSGRFVRAAAGELRAMVEPRRELLAAIAGAPDDALILVVCPGPREDRPMDYAVFNPRGLKSTPLVMAAADGAEVAVARYFKDYHGRRPMRLHAGRPPSFHPMADDEPYDIRIRAARSHRHTGTNARLSVDHPSDRVARAARDRPGMLAFGNYRHIHPGLFTAFFEVEISAGTPESVLRVEVTADGGRRVLAQGDVPAGFHGRWPLNFEADDYLTIEPRVYYHGGADVRLRFMQIVERMVFDE